MVETRTRCGVVGVALWLSASGCFEKQDASELGSDETGPIADATGSGGSGPITGDLGDSGELDSDDSGDTDIVGGEDGIAVPDLEPGESDTDGPDLAGPDLGGGGCGSEPSIDARRSLIETNPEALADITMPAILSRAALASDLLDDPEFTYGRLVDSFATLEAASLPGGSHCDDALVDGVPSLGGYPIQCPRAEAGQVDQIAQWFAIAAVNRFDLASADGSDCGEQRLILARGSDQRMFVIFEARIPNPEPSCGLAACRPIAEFWLGLADLDDASARNQELRAAFLDGHPILSAAGFEPFMAGVNLTFGSGQIRTNSFVDEPWTLREFRFVGEGTRLGAIAVPVTANSYGPLWNDLDPHPQGPACRQSILDNLDGLLVDELATMGMLLDPECFAGESREDETVDYAGSLLAGSGEFEAAIAERLAVLGSDLSPIELANRAAFASNCMGCHQSAIGQPLGHELFGPSSLGFVHVDELAQEPCGDGSCFMISKALADEFLPARAATLAAFWAEHGCVDACTDASPDAITLLRDGPATRGLPDASVGVDELRAYERELLDGSARTTLARRPRGLH